VNEPSTLGGDGPGDAIGLAYQELGAELVRATVPVTPVVQQPAGLVHGGVYTLIAESITSHATGRAVRDEGLVAFGQSSTAALLRPITEGAINALARRRHRGRSTWIWDVEISDDAEHLCALIRMTIAVRPADGASP
jgi:1,4-dihydroxy-2-naphthoyl-CoA hydrolase